MNPDINRWIEDRAAVLAKEYSRSVSRAKYQNQPPLTGDEVVEWLVGEGAAPEMAREHAPAVEALMRRFLRLPPEAV